jgi:hypothetical protein
LRVPRLAFLLYPHDKVTLEPTQKLVEVVQHDKLVR